MLSQIIPIYKTPTIMRLTPRLWNMAMENLLFVVAFRFKTSIYKDFPATFDYRRAFINSGVNLYKSLLLTIIKPSLTHYEAF